MRVVAGAVLALFILTHTAFADGRADVRAYVSRLEGLGFTGAIIVEENGQVLLNESMGLADRASNVPFRPDTVVNVASFSKTITATAVMRLVEDGRLSLSDPLSRFFPGVPADKAAITVGQLLSHSAGLTRDSLGGADIATREDCVRRILAKPLDHRVGEQFAYSNDGYHLLAEIVEIAAKRPFRDVVRDLVFKPAGMRSAGFVDEHRWAVPRVAHGYNEWKDVGTFEVWKGGGWKREGSGSVVATAEDLLRFVDAFFGGRLVRPETVALMTSVQARAPDSDGEDYGYGWFVATTSDGRALIFHSGDNLGYHTEVRWYPAAKRAIVVVTTQELFDESGSGLGVHKRIAATTISRVLNGATVELPPAARPISEAEEKALFGSYEMADGSRFYTYRPSIHGPLWFGADGQGAIDAIENATPARRELFAKANRRSLELMQAIVAQDASRLGALLPDNVHFFIKAWLGDFKDAQAKYGSFKTMRLIGTRSEITGEADLRTMFRLVFERGSYDFSFTWHGEDLYETLTDTGAPFALMLPLAATRDNTFVGFNFVRQTATTIEGNNLEQGRYTAITVNGVPAVRRE